MSKEIKDFLHLYLGCRLLVGSAYMDLTPERLSAYLVNINKILPVKPILRKLDSMTEGEQKDVCLIQFPDCKEVKQIFEQTISDGYGWSFECERGYRHYFSNHTYTPEAFSYMLSKGFDLFGLIDAKIAIDAKTINK